MHDDIEDESSYLPIQKRTPITEAGSVVAALEEIWQMWNLNDKLDFWENVFEGLWADEENSGEKQADEIKVAEDMRDWKGEKLEPGFKPAMIQIMIGMTACAYAIQAFKAEKNSPEAWAYCCEAKWYLGLLQGYMSGRGVNGREQAKKGAIAKNEPMAKLQAWVIGRYDQGSWASKHKASFDIAPEAVKQAPSFNTRLSQQRAQKTIYDWLRKHDITP